MARRSARLAKKKKQDAIADQDEEIRYSAAHRALAIPEILAEIMSHYVEHDRLLVPTFTAYQLVNRAWLKSLDRMVVASIGIFAGMGAIIHTYTSFRVSVRQMHLAGGFSAVKTLYTRASGYAYETTLIRDVATILPLCSNMTTLNICGNDLAALASLLPGSLATYLPKLKRLSCEAMFCTGSTVAFLSGFSRLTHLHIVNNWILGRPILPWDGLSTLFQVLGAHITYLEIGKVASNAVAEVLWNACSRLPCLLATKVRGYHLPAGFLLGLPQRLQRMEAECDPRVSSRSSRCLPTEINWMSTVRLLRSVCSMAGTIPTPTRMAASRPSWSSGLSTGGRDAPNGLCQYTFARDGLNA